jgi:hypothetical protein
MRAHPLLDVGEVTPDPELLQKIPHALALYYMALPIAGEDGMVSIAMAHPENVTALGVLSKLLGRPLVAVRGVSDAIRAALFEMPAAPRVAETPIFGLSTHPRSTESQAAVVAWMERLGAALDARTRLVEISAGLSDVHLSILAEGHPRLIVLDSTSEPLRSTVLRKATAPIFLVRGQGDTETQTRKVVPLCRVLVALRGFSSDEQALAWATTLAAEPDATVTVLPLTGTRVLALQKLADDKLRSCVKVRQGTPVTQILEEAAAGDYDLIVLAAEGEGVFAGQVLAELERSEVHTGRPVLILKPTL